MTNKHASKQHGLSTVKQQQPKSKLRKRRNKALAAIRRADRRAITDQLMATPDAPKKEKKVATPDAPKKEKKVASPKA